MTAIPESDDLFTGDLLLLRCRPQEHWLLKFYSDVERWLNVSNRYSPWTHICVLVRNPVLPNGTTQTGIFVITRNGVTPISYVRSLAEECVVRRLSPTATSKTITNSKVTTFLQTVTFSADSDHSVRTVLASLTGSTPSLLLPAAITGAFLESMGLVEAGWHSQLCRVDSCTSDSPHPVPWSESACYASESPLPAL